MVFLVVLDPSTLERVNGLTGKSENSLPETRFSVRVLFAKELAR